MLPPERRLKRRIARQGSISVADYMNEANAYYYGSRDPIGAAGDFTTAPEISQMFGELVGIWIADAWLRADRPGDVSFVELGPGRGTLAQDALRAMHRVGLDPIVHFVETSPLLRRAQGERVPHARWHDNLSTLPQAGPLMIVANEFFDALPVQQFDAAGREIKIRFDQHRFVRDEGEVAIERSPAAIDIVRELARRLVRQSGTALIIDYGHDEDGGGDTLQSVLAHQFADPWQAPGSRDLTALVDFAALGDAAREEGAMVRGPIGQGRWLETMGIELRAAALARASPERTEEIAAARNRLTAPSQMGRLFKVMTLTAPHWPTPSGLP